MHPEARGYYIESIFKDDCETIVRFDKVKLKMQVCSYDKKDDIYFLGNNHVQGKVEDKNGKVIKFINNKNVTIYTGRITQNKLLDSEYIELNQQLSKELAKSPNIFIFKDNSYIKSFLHPHKLKYKSAQTDSLCDFCLGNFTLDSETFGCRKCNFDLCKDCIFMEENIFFSKLINLMNKKNIQNFILII